MRDLCGVSAVSVPNPLLEAVETSFLVADQSATILALMGIEGTDEATVRVHRSLEFQQTSDH